MIFDFDQDIALARCSRGGLNGRNKIFGDGCYCCVSAHCN